MKRRDSVLFGFVVCCACGNVEQKREDDLVIGTYVREYSTEILNQLSGNKMGMRTVRDTLIITSAGDRYKVENSKWSMNDYDNDGWQNSKHGESGPLRDFKASYSESSGTLNSDGNEVPTLFITNDGKLSVGKNSEIKYVKVE